MKTLYLLILYFEPAFLFAQSNYQRGYVVKNNGDTIQGYINYQDWDFSPKTISYRVNIKNDSTQKLAPQDILSFEIPRKEKYFSYSGNITFDRNRFPDIPTGLDTTTIYNNIFLKLITEGENISLLSQKDGIKERYFIKAKEKYFELIFHEYSDGVSKSVKKEIYKNQLSFFANSYNTPSLNAITELLKISQFNKKDLESIVKRINNDTNSNSKSNKSNSRWFIGLGVNRATTTFNSIHSFLNQYQPTTTYLPKASAGLDIYSNPQLKKLILRLELGFSYLNQTLEEKEEVNISQFKFYTFKQYIGTTKAQIIYNVYIKQKRKLYITAGLAFHASKNSEHRLYTTDLNGVETSAHNPYFLHSTWLNFPLGLGLFFDKRSEISFEYLNSIVHTRLNGLQVRSQIFNFNYHYFLGKNSK